MGMMPTRMFPLGAGGTKLPYDAEVEYLESSGDAQYLDTGVSGPDIGYMQIVFEPLAGHRAYAGFFGWSATSSPSYLYAYSNIDQTKVSTRQVGINNIPYGKITLRKFAPGNVPANSFTLVVFGAKNGSGNVNQTARGRMRLYELQLWSPSDVFVRDFVPVRIEQTGYLYDRVTKQLFGNAGNGAFILGPDK